MAQDKWIETKKEYEINPDGEPVIKKITRELDNFRRKDRVDFFLRILPLAAISIPILLFTMQQKKEYDRQRSLFELETYTNTTTNIQLIMHKTPDDEEVQIAKDEIFFKQYPKLKFINDKQIVSIVDTLKTAIEYYIETGKLIQSLDSLYLYVNKEELQTEFRQQIANAGRGILKLNSILESNLELKNTPIDSLESRIGYFLGYFVDSLFVPIGHGKFSGLTEQDELNYPSKQDSLRSINKYFKRIILKKNLQLDSIMIKKLSH